MSSSPLTSHARPDRLPVNPRRNKVPAESRKRVAKACNGCNVRRAKCSGGQPCDRCRKASRECKYPALEETVTITKSEYEALRRTRASLEQGQPGLSPNGLDDHASGRRLSQGRESTDPGGNLGDTELSINEPDAPREGRILQDPHGTVRYLGESSGATFLNHLREFMATVFPVAFNTTWPGPRATETKFISALGHYQTHDSRPLLVSSADPLVVPSKDQARRMLAELRFWTQNGPATTASGGLYYWANTDDLLAQYEDYLADPQSPEASRNLALVNAAFAIACQFNPDCAPEWDAGHGQTFFARARMLIGNPLDVASLSDANVLTLLGFYLLNSYRRDASYMYISVALHIFLVHGVHRAWLIEEDGKRKFWNAYNLDRWLSCSMGRPAIVLDEAIKLDIPREAVGLPPPDGLHAYSELSRIMYYIASNVYGVSKHTAEPRSTALCIHKALNMLKQWECDLPDGLRYHADFPHQDSAAYELQMAANHLKILAVRAWLFDSVKNVTASICLRGHRDADVLHREEIDLAIAAARQTIDLIRRHGQAQRQSNLVHTVIHYAFNAALALELHQILSTTDLAADRRDITYATSLFELQVGSNKPFAHDCAGVLSDLAVMVGNLREIGCSPRSLSELGYAASASAHEEMIHGLPARSTLGLGPSRELTPRLLDASQVPTSSPLQSGIRQTAYNELVSWLQADNTSDQLF